MGAEATPPVTFTITETSTRHRQQTVTLQLGRGDTVLPSLDILY